MNISISAIKMMESSLSTLHIAKPDTFVKRNNPDKILSDYVSEKELEIGDREEVEILRFAEEFKELFTDIRLNLITFPDEVDVYQYLYAFYCLNCYQKNKLVPFTEEEFTGIYLACVEKEENVFHVNAVPLCEEGESYVQLWSQFRRLMKSATAANMIEDNVDREKTLEEQSEVIKKILKMCEQRYNFEADVLNSMINELFDMSYCDVLPGDFYYYFEGKELTWYSHNGGIHLDEMETTKLYNSKFEEIDIGNAEEHIEYIKNYSKHYHDVKDEFSKNGIEVLIFFDYEQENTLLIYVEGIEFSLSFEGDTMYRKTGEEILNLCAVIHEMNEEIKNIVQNLEIADKKAIKHFMSTLTKNEQDEFTNKKAVVIKGVEYDFILHDKASYNNIIRISKVDKENVQLMCITPKNPRVSKYDVKATVTLLIKSGKENEVNEIGNLFTPLCSDWEIIKEMTS